MQPDLIGGRYRVLSAIGQGGMGTVWLCRDETLARLVAVKQVGLPPGESVTDSARAFREARSSAGLSHRNVVTVFDVVEEDGHIWLVMEHVPGRSLSQIIKEDGPIAPGAVAEIGAQVADGLAAAHAAGTTHRDVKPGNVLVREDGAALISDFGIARNTADPALTLSGFLTGTPSYFSPELARGAEPSTADDVWALGATLYAGVEGRSPYAAQTNPVAVLHEIASSDPPAPVRAEFLEPVLRRMMDRDPGSRWSMEDAAHVLRRLADEHGREDTRRDTRPSAPVVTPPEPDTTAVAAPDPEPTPAPAAAPAPEAAPVRSSSPARRRRPGALLLAALGVVALLLVIGILAFVSSHNGADTGGNSTAGSGAAKPSATKKPSPSPSRTTAAPRSAAAREGFVRDYYAAAPGGTDRAWAMLGPHEQDQGRDAYNGFWRTISSVEVTSARAGSGDTVDVTLVYRTTDGRTSTEHKREGLVSSPDGGYLLDSDVPAG